MPPPWRRTSVFRAAGALYGLTFSERTDLVGYHPDVAFASADSTAVTTSGSAARGR